MCSMISSQCDELRNAADKLDERAKLYAPTGRNVLSPMLRTAADTIWELRCKLAGVVDQRDEIEWLKAENAKLRELVAEMYEAVKCCCDECWFGYGRNPAKCENENCGYRKEYVAMRELGVRLDG